VPVTDNDAKKTFVVTGCTSGIGLALAHALASTAERLVIIGRDESFGDGPVDLEKAVVRKTLEILGDRTSSN
jgi:short-subunit dehydrogenase